MNVTSYLAAEQNGTEIRLFDDLVVWLRPWHNRQHKHEIARRLALLSEEDRGKGWLAAEIDLAAAAGTVLTNFKGFEVDDDATGEKREVVFSVEVAERLLLEVTPFGYAVKAMAEALQMTEVMPWLEAVKKNAEARRSGAPATVHPFATISTSSKKTRRSTTSARPRQKRKAS